MTTTSPDLRVGRRNCWTQAQKLSPLIGPSSILGAVKPAERKAATKVVVVQNYPWRFTIAVLNFDWINVGVV
jgi:hypothetical protein